MVNKNDLVEALAPRLGGRSAAALAVETIVDVVLREVAAGESVTITGFGTFEPVERAPRTGRNPHTGEPVPIPATLTPRFRPSSYFKAVVADPQRLPDQGLAGVRTHAVEGDGRSADHGETGRAGAPASIRRTEAPAEPVPGPGEPEAPAPPSRGGQPATVRAERPAPEESPAVEPARDPGPTTSGRSIGGDQITADMISAKKAARARAASQEGGVPEPGKKKKKKKKGKKDGKGAKKGT